MNIADDLNKANMLNQVPQLTISFWIFKIMATTVGETVADLLSLKLNLGLIVASLAVGLLAEGANLGYTYSAPLFAGSIALVTLAYYKFGLNAVVAFWVAYILTRPLGASLGDLMSQPTSNGGLGLGTVMTSAAFLVVILGLVIFMSERLDEAQPATRAAG